MENSSGGGDRILASPGHVQIRLIGQFHRGNALQRIAGKQAGNAVIPVQYGGTQVRWQSAR